MFDLMKGASFCHKVGIGGWIFAGEVEFPDDSSGGEIGVLGLGGVFPGRGEVSEKEGEKGCGGVNTAIFHNFKKAPSIPPADAEARYPAQEKTAVAKG